jgi:hypothetical protein
MAVQRFPKVRNAENTGCTVFVGTVFENRVTQRALLSAKPKLEHIFVRTQDGASQKSGAEVKNEVASAISGKRNALVISDVGDTRDYTFEKLASDVKTIDAGASYALLTSRQECAGIHVVMDEFVKERGFDPSVLSKVDYIINYAGNDNVFTALLQLHEDRLNYRLDNERVILVIEDMPSYYTGFLLSLEKINESRTRVLLARDFETASRLVEETKGRLAGAIVDMRFPKGSRLADDACWEVEKLIREYDPKAPIVFQSADESLIARAEGDPRVFTLSKGDPLIFNKLRDIINDNFGFGPFVFRTVPGLEIARVDTLADMWSFIKSATPGSIMAESAIYHAKFNSFSNWLWLHGYKGAAEQLKLSNSQSIGELKQNFFSACERYLVPEKR